MAMTPDTIVRAALYIRVSTEEQALHGYSLEAQETALVEYAASKGYKVMGIYRDEGFSARKPVLKRPKMQELLHDVEIGKVDLILFTKLDRWFRNVGDYHAVQIVLDRHKVQWRAILEDYQTETADGRLKVNIMLSVAENEADRTSERIKFVLENKRNKKEACFGGPHMTLGYKKEKIDGVPRLVKDPETAPIIEMFWERVLKYGSIRKAGMYVNAEFGISRRYKSWTDTARNELYSGQYKGVPDFCPAYVSREDWENIQQANVRIKTSPKDRIYLFTGLLRCPGCGRTLKANYKVYKPNPEKEYFQYRCNNGRLTMCEYGGKAISELRIEKYLLANVRKDLEAYITSTEVAGSQRRTKKKASDVKKLQEQLRRLNVIYLDGNLDDAEYTRRTATIKDAIEKAKQEEADNKPLDLSAIRALLDSDFEKIYADLDREDKRRLWRSIIKEIHVYKDVNKVKEIIFKV